MLYVCNKREEEIKVKKYAFGCTICISGEDVWAMSMVFVMVFVEARGDGVIYNCCGDRDVLVISLYILFILLLYN